MHTSSFTFTDIRKYNFEINAGLKRLRDFTLRLGMAEATTHVDALLEHVERQNFTIAVVGEFKSGKSTFINALLEREILPADIVPTSATLNRVTYGLKPLVRLVYHAKAGQPERVEEIEIQQLGDFVTKWTAESETVAATIREAVVYYPVAYCRNNVDIIDTPGVNDTSEMTEVTMSVLPSLDAAIYVIKPESPFANTEGEFLEKLFAQGIGRVIFVVTAMDRRSPADGERLLHGIRERIKKRIVQYAERTLGAGSPACQEYLHKNGEPKVLGLSGYQALQAKLTHNMSMLEESRFPEFEKVLEKFLTEESGIVALRSSLERVSRLCEQVLAEAGRQSQALVQQPSDFEDDFTRLEAFLEALVQMTQQELRQLETNVSKSQEKLKPRIPRFLPELRMATIRAVDEGAIKPDELDPAQYGQLLQRLGYSTSERVKDALLKYTEELSQVAEGEIKSECTRLAPYAVTFDRLLFYVQDEFWRIDQRLSGNTVPSRVQPANFSLLRNLGSEVSFSTGLVQDRLGQIDAFRSALSAERLAQDLSLPDSWVGQIQAPVPATSTGSGLIKKASDLMRVNGFQNNYKTASGYTLEAQLQACGWEGRLNKWLSGVFDPLRWQLNQVDAGLRNVLMELRSKREKVALTQRLRSDDFRVMERDTQTILNKMGSLLHQLNRVVEN
jgi:predicted GTPase